MRNPFRHFCKSRGIPDYTVHQNSNNQQNNASVLAPSRPSQPFFPVEYSTQNSHNQQTNAPALEPQAFEPPTAFPAQQDASEKEAEWEINAGNNINKKGQQKTGDIRVGNTLNGATLPVNLPRKGRFVFNTGGNTNEGVLQEAGSVEFANVR